MRWRRLGGHLDRSAAAEVDGECSVGSWSLADLEAIYVFQGGTGLGVAEGNSERSSRWESGESSLLCVCYSLERSSLEIGIIFRLYLRTVSVTSRFESALCYKSLWEPATLTSRILSLFPPPPPPDYLIRHYGNGRFVATSPDNLDLDIFWSHFAEGSLMPTLVMKLIFTIIPTQAPFLVRPLVNAVCSGVNSKFVDPDVSFLSIWSIARCLCASWLTPFRFPFVRIG